MKRDTPMLTLVALQLGCAAITAGFYVAVRPRLADTFRSSGTALTFGASLALGPLLPALVALCTLWSLWWWRSSGARGVRVRRLAAATALSGIAAVAAMLAAVWPLLRA